MCNPRKIKSYNKTLYVGGNTISKSDKKGATYNILRIYKIEKKKMVKKISLVDLYICKHVFGIILLLFDNKIVLHRFVNP